MDEGFRVVPDELRRYAEYIRGMVGDLEEIDRYARDQGGDTVGFTGMLAVLQPAVHGVGALFSETLGIGKDRLGATAQGLHDSAACYEALDRNAAAAADRLAGRVRDLS